MKKHAFLYAILAVAVLVGILVSCAKPVENTDTSSTIIYTEDTELGEGAKTLSVEVVMPDSTVKFTVHTDKDTVGEALYELGIIDGEQGPYGLYVKKVNGVIADYDIDQSYWAFNINGEYATSGMDTTEITEGDTYQIVYTK